ncbi:MAG: hypothetical protein HYV26_16170, partial [Candidatus Hydrogenedentes bacterium]|nr:hypothetical protein [Candidatus Hydrogenedentota bacterium]
WSNAAPASGQTEFTKSVDIPGEVASAGMVVALGDLHQIFVNDQLIADQGNFDPYFTSRAEHYDLSSVLQPGENIIKVVARDSSGPTGMQLDGCAWLKDGGSVVFVSDTGFLSRASDQTAAGGETARILPGPSHGYMGDPALLMLQPRPHPLPLAGWLVNQAPPPAPFDALVFAADTVQPPAQWFRFKLPPGATEMTLPTRGAVQAWVNGTPAQTAQVEGGWRVHLAEQDAPARTAAVRVEVSAGSTAGAAFDTPITFAMGEGMIPVGSWDELGLPHYSGGLVYKADLSLDKALPYALLDLGHVRGTAEVKVNGKACGVRLWHPYQFDLSQALQTGNNTIEIRVFNTLGPHFAEGHPSQHVYKNHTKSGIFGPIALRMTTPTEFKLEAE